jgi:hypothetical protein
VNLQSWKKFYYILYQRNDTEFSIHQYHSPKLLLLKKFLSLFIFRLSCSESERVKKSQTFVGELYIHLYVYVHIHMYIYFRITYMYTYIRMFMFIFICTFTFVFMFIFMCIYKQYIHVYVYIYVHICIHIYLILMIIVMLTWIMLIKMISAEL